MLFLVRSLDAAVLATVLQEPVILRVHLDGLAVCRSLGVLLSSFVDASTRCGVTPGLFLVLALLARRSVWLWAVNGLVLAVVLGLAGGNIVPFNALVLIVIANLAAPEASDLRPLAQQNEKADLR